MLVSDVMQRFIVGSPIPVMFRAAMEFAFPDTVLDRVFREHAQRQYEDQLLFSTVVKVLSLVVCRGRKSVNEAYAAVREEAAVSVQALYDKLKKTEPAVTGALVRESFLRLRPVMRKLKAQRSPLLPGYRTKILDGAHLAGTERRLRETRTLHSVPLPGQALVVLEPDERLISGLFPCHDAHAQERSLLDAVLETVEPGDALLADRNFCTTGFFFALVRRQAGFLIRQHSSTLNEKKLLGQPRRVGRVERGVLYEQPLQITDPLTGEILVLRRLTIVLDRPLENGETEIHLLTNLPRRLSARRLAQAYLQRWQIEHAFQEIEQALRGEVNTLGYPPAALLAFSIAVLIYNLLSVVKGGLQAQHGAAAAFDQLSGYYLASEIAAVYGGLIIGVPPREWTASFGNCSAHQLAIFLRDTAAHAQPARFSRQIRGPKKPPPQRTGGFREKHVSTYRLISQRKMTATKA
jgi:DDE family transposase